MICHKIDNLKLSDESNSDVLDGMNDDVDEDDDDDDDAICPKCGISANDTNDHWVACDGGCKQWYDFKCTNIRRG